MTRLNIAQVGTTHGHAAGKWQALLANSEVRAIGPFTSFAEIPDIRDVSAVAVEVRNHESLAIARQVVAAGKHLWLDKPAGDDWREFEQSIAIAREKHLHVQLGYMFRYHPGFAHVADVARSGQLGDIFAVRANMSTWIDIAERTRQSRHRGGILYDLSGHMLDQIVWLLGRPTRAHTVLRNDATAEVPSYSDNTVAVLEFPHALALVDIAAMEQRPTARRFEVYGTRGSAILEPFEPDPALRVVTPDGAQLVELPRVERQELYDRELAAFVGVLRGEREPDRSLDHELLVQETLLRATGAI